MFSTWPRKRVAAPAILAISALLPAGGAAAVDFTWDGGGATNNFNDSANWNPDGAPPLDLATCGFIFGPTATDPDPQTANAQNLAFVNIGGLAFTGAMASYTINAGVLGSFSFNDAAVIMNDSMMAQTINVDLFGTGTSLVLDAMAGGLTIGGDIDLSDAVGVKLTVRGGLDTTISGIISGAGGSLLKEDAGRLTLTMFNTFDGGTELAGGTIVLGNNRALGEGDLTVTANGTLESNTDTRRMLVGITIDPGVTLTIGGQSLEVNSEISGDGTLTINMTAGADILTLRGDNNAYNGDTTLLQGTVLLANDNALGNGSLLVTGTSAIQSDDNARNVTNGITISDMEALIFSGSNDLELSGVIVGMGGLTVNAGSGTALRLSGTNIYTGDTAIDEGELILEGSITSIVNINDGGTLSGTGTIDLMAMGDVTNNSGGTLAPGNNGVGTLTTDNGDYMQLAGSTLSVELDADTLMADVLRIMNGGATLDLGSTIAPSLVGDGYIPDATTFTIIDADTGVMDNGATVSTALASATVQLVGSVDVNSDYVITLQRPATAYSTAADAGNNRAIGGGLDSLIAVADGDPAGAAGDLLGSLDGLNAADYNTAVKQLSPEPYNTSTGTAIENGVSFTTQQTSYLAAKRSGIESWARSMQSSGPLPGSLASAHTDTALLAAALAEMQEPPLDTTGRSESRLGGYAKVQAIFSNQDTTANRTGYDADAFGGQMGVDYRFTRDFLAGVAVGYTFTRADLDSDLGEIDDSTVRVGPYFSWVRGDWYLDGSATFGYHFFDNERNIPALGLTANGDYDGYDVVAYLGTGYQVELTDHFYLTPMTSIQYSYFHFDSFTESGAGGANLTIGDRNTDSLRTRLGVNLSYELDLDTLFVPFVYGGWEHEFLEDDEIEASFATGGSPFTIDTGTRNEDSGFIGVGMHVLLDPYVSGFIRYEHSFAEDGEVSGIAAGLSFAF